MCTADCASAVPFMRAMGENAHTSRRESSPQRNTCSLATKYRYGSKAMLSRMGSKSMLWLATTSMGPHSGAHTGAQKPSARQIGPPRTRFKTRMTRT